MRGGVREEWRSRARCRPPRALHIDFFAEDSDGQQQAKEFCQGCSVKTECLAEEEAAEVGQPVKFIKQMGVFGGMTGDERASKRHAIVRQMEQSE